MKTIWCVLVCGVFGVGGVGTVRAQYNPELGDVGGNQWEASASAEGVPGARDERAEADPERSGIDYSGSVRLGLDTVLFSFVSASAEREVGDATEVTDATMVRFGVVPSELGLNGGYALLDQLVVGARLQLSTFSGSESRGTIENDSSGFSLSLRPYCEYVFTPGETLEWLAYGTLGITSVSTETAGVEVSRFDFLLGVGGGAHIVLSEHVSIDPLAELGYAVGSLSEDTTDYDRSNLVFALRAGISVWL